MPDNVFYRTLARYFTGVCTREEKDNMTKWIREDPEREAIFKDLSRLWESNPAQSAKWDVEARWKQMSQKMRGFEAGKQTITRTVHTKKKRDDQLYNTRSKTRVIIFKQWLGRSAAAVLLVGLVSLAVYQFGGFDSEVAEVLPEREIITQSGQRASIQLVDGTLVRVNADSRLTIFDEFVDDSRVVYLKGEAFFEVRKTQDERSFKVHTDKSVIEVHGTKFNVQAYDDEPFKVVVSSGIVGVRDIESAVDNEILLYEKDMILNENDQNLLFHEIDLDKHLAWLDHRLVFDHTPLWQVAKTLERWYRVNVHISDAEIKHLRVTGSFHNEPIYEVLRLLSLGLDLDYAVNGRSVVFYSKSNSQ